MTLSSKRRARTLIIKFIDDLFENSIEPLYEQEFLESNLVYLISKKELLEKKYAKFEKLNEEIGDLIEKDEDFEQDTELVQRYELLFSKKLTILSIYIKDNDNKLRKGKATSSSHSTVFGDKSKVPVKLPRFEIKSFSGEPTEWQSFKQSFAEAIDKHPGLSPY